MNENNENQEIKIGLGTFTIIVISLVLLVVTICGAIYLNHVATVNNETTKNKTNRYNGINSGIVGTNNSVNNTVQETQKIDLQNIYAFTCKSVIAGSQYDLENTLVAIDKNTGNETQIMKFHSGAYDYADGKLYFYENTANSYHRFYVIDLEKGIEPSEIYSFEYKYGTTDNLEYYNNKLYYTFNGELLCLNLLDNQIEHIAIVKNYIFKINNTTNKIYYVNDKEELTEMDLTTNEEKTIDVNAGIIEVTDNKLLYVKMENILEDTYETWYWSYDLQSGNKNRIVASFVGEVGKSEILMNNSTYIYLNGEGQLCLIDENDNMQTLTDEGNFSTLTILPNNNILVERNEGQEGMDNYKTYIYNMETMQLLQTSNNYRYSYTKYM